MPDVGGAKPAGIGVSLVVVLGAFAAGVEPGLMFLLGLGSQWALKAPAKVKDYIGVVVALVACLGAYAILHHVPGFYAQEAWWRAACVWSLAALGAGSVAGQTGAAPKTNSL